MGLEEVKQYLHVDFDDDDLLIAEFIEVSQAYLDTTVGTAYKNNESLVKIANIVQKKLIHDMYMNRDTRAINKAQNRMVTTILDVLSNAGE